LEEARQRILFTTTMRELPIQTLFVFAWVFG